MIEVEAFQFSCLQLSNPSRRKRTFCRNVSYCRALQGIVTSRASSSSSPPTEPNDEDFVSKVLNDNPSQIEFKYLIDGKLYTTQQKQELKRWSRYVFRGLSWKRSDASDETIVPESKKRAYLNDILREYKGKFYVPKQILKQDSSQEEEFDSSYEKLPQMDFDDFIKAAMADKVKLLTSKEFSLGGALSGCKDFIVELKDIPGDKQCHTTKWAMKLDDYEVRLLVESYKGPQYEIGNTLKALVETMPEHPHPAAATISSWIMMEFVTVTAVITTVIALLAKLLAFAVCSTASLFLPFAQIIVATMRPLMTSLINSILDASNGIWKLIFIPSGEGSVASKLSVVSQLGSGTLNVMLAQRIFIVFVAMGFVMRFALSRKPKDFRKWDIWQGLDFSRSKPEARVDGAIEVRFSDVAGIDEAVDELQELVRYLKNPEVFDKMGIKAPHGVLLEGPPGCGKTLVAKAIAGEAGVPFYQMAGSEFVEILVGVGSARIRDLFKRAKVNKPAVVFVDEIDALAARREGALKRRGDDIHNAAIQERETALNQLLTELDGFDTGKGVVFLAATNRKDLLDPAILRPGRFDRKIRIRHPNAPGRLAILKVHGSKVKMSDSVDLSVYANNLQGWTGAMLSQLIQEAAMSAIREGHSSIQTTDMDDALYRLTAGPKQSGVKLSHQGLRRRAVTEMGVALTSHLLIRYQNADLEFCQRVSIVPRGQTLSQLVFRKLNDEAYLHERRPQLLHRMQVLLGGRAAEEVVYGRDTSRASAKYLAHASWLARKMITIWNTTSTFAMSGESSPWAKEEDDQGMVEAAINLRLVDHVAIASEEILSTMYRNTVDLLRRHRLALLEAVEILVEQKEMRGEEIDNVISKYEEEEEKRNV